MNPQGPAATATSAEGFLCPEHGGGKFTVLSGKKVRHFDRERIVRRENVTALFFMKAASRGEAGPGMWFSDDGPVLVCPECGTLSPIPLGPNGYRIDSRGLVYPSVLCEKPECSFDHYVLLKGWSSMGVFSRSKEREEGKILYCMVWKKWQKGPLGEGFYLQPFEYCHAASEAEAREQFSGLLLSTVKPQGGILIAIAPSFDPHVAGYADRAESILSER